MIDKREKIISLTFAIALASLLGACPLRVETTHKIDAHIIIDIRQEAAALEGQVRGEGGLEPFSYAPSLRQFEVADVSPRASERSLWQIFDPSSSAYAADQTEQDKQDAVARRKTRHKQVDQALADRCVGESNLGYLAVRPCDKTDEEKAVLKKMIEDENKDRKSIYETLALSKDLKKEDAKIIGMIYAAEHFKHLKKDMWLQVPKDDDRYAEFIASEIGKTYNKPKKDDWVLAPEPKKKF